MSRRRRADRRADRGAGGAGCGLDCPCQIPFFDGRAKTVFSTSERILMIEVARWRGKRVFREVREEGATPRAKDDPLAQTKD